MKEANSDPKLDEIRARIREAGLRGTAARVAVLRLLTEATTPLSHAEVAKQLDSRDFDKATIYRNLVELSEAGIVSRVEVGDHVWRFELRRKGGDDQFEHPHFLCVDCGEVSCLSSADVKIVPSGIAHSAVIGEVTEVLLKGHCERCSK